MKGWKLLLPREQARSRREGRQQPGWAMSLEHLRSTCTDRPQYCATETHIGFITLKGSLSRVCLYTLIVVYIPTKFPVSCVSRMFATAPSSQLKPPPNTNALSLLRQFLANFPYSEKRKEGLSSPCCLCFPLFSFVLYGVHVVSKESKTS
jgi:hypothetical protein